MSEDAKRLRPDVMQVALLDEIAERLLSLEEMQRSQEPQGIVDVIQPPITVTDQKRQLKPTEGAWFSVSIINDGHEDVWAIINTIKSFQPHLIRAGETYPVAFNRPVIKDVLLYCDKDKTTQVRFIGVR
jgi:hypothetical protein